MTLYVRSFIYHFRILMHQEQTEHRDSIRELTKASHVALTYPAGLILLNLGLPYQQYHGARSVFVGSSTCFDAQHNNEAASRFEEAGHYLTTLKQFEYKPPDIIKERVDKDYHSILRTALTSISRVNKTDVETLRTSFGVSVTTSDQVVFSHDD